MKIAFSVLKSLIRESLASTRIIKERPWAVEHEFSLSAGSAEDAEGPAADGFAIVLKGESGKTVRVIVDTYWNPHSADNSGNSLKIEIDGQVPPAAETYVPVKFDTGTKQKIIISNSPVSELLTVAHAADLKAIPIVLLAVQNPFDIDEDIEFDVKNLGNGKFNADVVRFSSI